MGVKRLYVLLATITFSLLLSSSIGADENPKNRLDFWERNYKELSPEDDPRAAKAHHIFKRILRAAGRRPGVTPRLYIVKSGSPYVPLAFAIPAPHNLDMEEREYVSFS